MAAVRGFLAGAGARAWLVGGALRDLLMGREPHDLDLVTSGEPAPLARRFADSIGGSFFTMSEEFMTCRVVAPEGGTNWDFSRMRGASIEDDLRERDFTVNAIALEFPEGAALVDPLGGGADLAAGRLAPVSEDVFAHDPLRLLRAVRLEKTTGLIIDDALARRIRASAYLAGQPAPERIFAELGHLLAAPGTAAAVRRLDGLGLLAVLLPELTALKGVMQNEYHHLDVFEHTLANSEALDCVITSPASFFPERADQLEERMRGRVAGDAGWKLVMALASLLHDSGKPGAQFTDTDGQVRFFEHDRRGAELAAAILSRLKASAGMIRAVSFLVRKHMRFEGLIQQYPPSERARLRYMRATEPYTPELIMLSVADRLSVRGRLVTEADVERHLALAREMMNSWFEREEAVPLPKLAGGNDLMRELGLKPGTLLGELLDGIREEQELGRITTREEALELASRLLKERREED